MVVNVAIVLLHKGVESRLQCTAKVSMVVRASARSKFPWYCAKYLVHSAACSRLVFLACGTAMAASLTLIPETSGILGCQGADQLASGKLHTVSSNNPTTGGSAAGAAPRGSADSLTSNDHTAMSVEAIGGDSVMGSTAMLQQTAFADHFEAAFLEESMSLDPMDEASAASTFINYLGVHLRFHAIASLSSLSSMLSRHLQVL